MISLLNILKEIRVVSSNYNKYVNTKEINELIPPNRNDTMLTWLRKNHLMISYSDKVKGGYSIKIYGEDFINKDEFYNDVREDGEHGQYTDNIKKRKLAGEIAVFLLKSLNHYFARNCGENRIKVSLSLEGHPINIRFIIPQKAKDFKMIPSND